MILNVHNRMEIQSDYFVYIQLDCKAIPESIHIATTNCGLFLQQILNFVLVNRAVKINIKLKITKCVSFNSQSLSLFSLDVDEYYVRCKNTSNIRDYQCVVESQQNSFGNSYNHQE